MKTEKQRINKLCINCENRLIFHHNIEDRNPLQSQEPIMHDIIGSFLEIPDRPDGSGGSDGSENSAIEPFAKIYETLNPEQKEEAVNNLNTTNQKLSELIELLQSTLGELIAIFESNVPKDKNKDKDKEEKKDTTDYCSRQIKEQSSVYQNLGVKSFDISKSTEGVLRKANDEIKNQDSESKEHVVLICNLDQNIPIEDHIEFLIKNGYINKSNAKDVAIVLKCGMPVITTTKSGAMITLSINNKAKNNSGRALYIPRSNDGELTQSSRVVYYKSYENDDNADLDNMVVSFGEPRRYDEYKPNRLFSGADYQDDQVVSYSETTEPYLDKNKTEPVNEGIISEEESEIHVEDNDAGQSDEFFTEKAEEYPEEEIENNTFIPTQKPAPHKTDTVEGNRKEDTSTIDIKDSNNNNLNETYFSEPSTDEVSKPGNDTTLSDNEEAESDHALSKAASDKDQEENEEKGFFDNIAGFFGFGDNKENEQPQEQHTDITQTQKATTPSFQQKPETYTNNQEVTESAEKKEKINALKRLERAGLQNTEIFKELSKIEPVEGEKIGAILMAPTETFYDNIRIFDWLHNALKIKTKMNCDNYITLKHPSNNEYKAAILASPFIDQLSVVGHGGESSIETQDNYLHEDDLASIVEQYGYKDDSWRPLTHLYKETCGTENDKFGDSVAYKVTNYTNMLVPFLSGNENTRDTNVNNEIILARKNAHIDSA